MKIKTLFYVITIVLTALLAAISIIAPEVINQNKFLTGFINQEILNIQCVIVTVTLVSIAQAHIEYSRLEAAAEAKVFDKARRELNNTASVLVSTLFLLLIILIFIGGTNNESIALALMKSFALLLLTIAILSMADIGRTIAAIAGE